MAEKIAQESLPHLSVEDLAQALKTVLHRASLQTHHVVEQEVLSVQDRMRQILQRVTRADTVFTDLFEVTEGRQGVTVTFMAILELLKSAMIECVQQRRLDQST